MATLWDARAERDVGLFIERYLTENPPPDGALYADDLAEWARNLKDAGTRCLDACGASPLRSIGGGA